MTTNTNQSTAFAIAENLANLTGKNIIEHPYNSKYDGKYTVELAYGVFAVIIYDTTVRLNANIEGIHNTYFDVTGKDGKAVAENLLQIMKM